MGEPGPSEPEDGPSRAPCEGCKRELATVAGLCRECSASRPRCVGFFGRLNLLYNALARGADATEPGGNGRSGSIQTMIKRLKRSESVFTRIKRFYRNITEEELSESGESEFNDIVLQTDDSTTLPPTNQPTNLRAVGSDTTTSTNTATGTTNAITNTTNSTSGTSATTITATTTAITSTGSNDGNESGDKGAPEATLEDDLLDSFSSLSVKIRAEELARMHEVLKRYRHSESRLNAKLLRSGARAREYDLLPRLGEREHDVWGLRAGLEDDTLEYLGVLFFRQGGPRPRCPLEEIQISINRARHGQGVLVDRFGIEITREKIACLLGSNWLNDEVINLYLQILQQKTLESEGPSCHFFNTFFFQALSGGDVAGVEYDYKAVARWTRRRKVNVFEKDLILVPVHVSKVHWALGVVEMRKRWRRIMIFDSLGGSNPRFFKNMRRWLQDEHQDKTRTRIERIEDWKIPPRYAAERYAPSQQNSYDCGLFLCQFAKSIALGTGFSFTNESSTYLRNLMVHELLSCNIEM